MTDLLTPAELFRVRCSSCHELRTERVCEFAPSLRPSIVATMRRSHGADEVIDDEEAALIERHLADPALCREGGDEQGGTVGREQ